MIKGIKKYEFADKLYIIENFVFPSPFHKDEECLVGVVVPFDPRGDVFINTDKPRAVPVCFDTKEDCIKWMTSEFPDYKLIEEK